MLHLLILVFRLFGQDGYIGRDIPTLDHEISAASDEHVVLAVVYVDHIQHHILILRHHQVFLNYLFAALLSTLQYRRLDCQRLLA